MTHSITRIVVATDLSARSDRAVERAFQIAGMLSLPVEAVLVLDDALPDTLLSPLHEKAVMQLDAICARSGEGLKYTINVQSGDPTEELVKAAEPAEGTLLVMGPHRPRPFLDLLRETTMQRVVRRTGAAVLLASEPVVGPYRNVLAMIDFNEPSDNALTLGGAIAPEAERIEPMHAVHIPYSGTLDTTGTVQLDLQQSLHDEAVATEKKWRADLGDFAQRLAPSRIASVAPESMILEATSDRAFDLLTAGAHGPVGARRVLLGSLATDLMRNPPCDVLIAR